MEKIRVAVVGYGNIGKYTLEAIEASSDMFCAGVVRRSGSAEGIAELQNLKVVSDIRELGKVDVAVLATPSRKVSIPLTASISTATSSAFAMNSTP